MKTIRKRCVDCKAKFTRSPQPNQNKADLDYCPTCQPRFLAENKKTTNYNGSKTQFKEN